MILPVPWQRGAGLLNGEEALLHTHLSVTFAAGAGLGLSAGLGATAFAGTAFLTGGNAYLRFSAVRGLFERDLEVVA